MQDPKKSSMAPSYNFVGVGYIFATKACIDNRNKKLVKQQYLPFMSSQYGELRPTNGWDLFESLGHPSKFQWVLRLAFVTRRRSPEANQTLHYVWPSSGLLHYTLSGALAPWQNSLYVQVWRSPILAALLQGTPAVGTSETLRRWANGAKYIRQGSRHVGPRPTF